MDSGTAGTMCCLASAPRRALADASEGNLLHGLSGRCLSVAAGTGQPRLELCEWGRFATSPQLWVLTASSTPATLENTGNCSRRGNGA